MKQHTLTEKSWDLKSSKNNASSWKFTMDLINEWERFDDSTDDLEQTDAINSAELQPLLNKIKSYEDKLGPIKNQEYNIVLYFIEHAKTVDQFEKSWEKFIEFMTDNKIYVKTFRTNNTK